MIKYITLSICFVALLTSCQEKCKDCAFEEKTTFLNRPQFSGISPNQFNDIDYFNESSYGQLVGEVCGENLDELEKGNHSDTIPIQVYEDNNGDIQNVPGGIFQIITQHYTCN